jgi:hypothetical protein
MIQPKFPEEHEIHLHSTHEFCRAPVYARLWFRRCTVIHYFYATMRFHLANLRRTKGSSICETVSAAMFYFYSTLRFTDEEFVSCSTYIRPELKMDAKHFEYRTEYNQSWSIHKSSHAQSSNLRGKVNNYCDNGLMTVAVCSSY